MTQGQGEEPVKIGRIWQNAAWLSAIPILLNFVAVFSTGYITRRVGAESFGRFSIGLAISGLTLTVTDMGLRALAVRDLSRSGPGSHRALSDLLSLRLLMSSISTVLAWCIAAAVSTESGLAPVILVSSLSIVPTALTGIFIDGLVARDLARETSGSTFLSGVLLTAASVAAVALWPTEIALAASYVIGPVVNVTLLAYRSRVHYGRFQFRWRTRQWRVLIHRAAPFFRVGLVGTAVSRLELPLIGWLLGTRMAGIYAASTSLADRLGGIVDSAITAALPSMMRLRGNAERIREILAKILYPLLSATMAGGIMAMMGTTAAVTVVFGAEYAPGGPALAVALFSLPLFALNGMLSEGFIALRRVELITSTAQRGQLVTAVLLPLLTFTLGLPGAPLAKLCGSATAAAQRVWASRVAFTGLWDRHPLRSLAAACLWALPMPIILWFGDFRPPVTVAIAGGGFLCWIGMTAHSTGALKILWAAIGQRGVTPEPREPLVP